MQTICSITRLVSDPDGAAEVLLDFGDLTEGDPDVQCGQVVQAVRYPGGRGAAAIPRGNNEVRVSWSRIFRFATPQQARAYGAAARANTRWSRRAPLDEVWSDGSRVRTHGVVIESVEAECLTSGNRHWCILRYEAVGGMTTVEASGGFAADNWEAQNETWDGWAEKFNHITGLLTTH